MSEYRKYFKNNEELLNKLERLHKKKYALKHIIDLESNFEPFIVEFSGLPRTGKAVVYLEFMIFLNKLILK